MITTHQGYIQFTSKGAQYIRQQQFFHFEQTISFTELYSYSYDHTPDQENPNRNRDDVAQQQKDLADYENYKKTSAE